MPCKLAVLKPSIACGLSLLLCNSTTLQANTFQQKSTVKVTAFNTKKIRRKVCIYFEATYFISCQIFHTSEIFRVVWKYYVLDKFCFTFQNVKHKYFMAEIYTLGRTLCMCSRECYVNSLYSYIKYICSWHL
jgi:hypothetical protein